jgi:uncharacterized protein (DUF2141 family)
MIPRRFIAASAGALVLAGASAAHAQAPGVLRVVVTNVRRALGHVRVEVCTPAEFLKSCEHGGAAPAVAGTTVVEVRDLPPGRYAIQAYLDENDNHEVDQNFIGVPKEGVGFSNDAPFGLGPPTFRRAAFSHGDAADEVTLRLRYLPG